MSRQPETTFDMSEPADYRALDRRAFLVIKNGLTFACRFVITPGADRLVVIPESWADRSKGPPLLFHRWSWGPRMNAHILSISDPTLFLDDELISACFLGHWLRDPMPILAEIAAWFASSMKLGAEDWLFYGASAGGFAAMRAAALIPNGRAIVVNAFLELDCFDGRHLSARIAKVFGANMSLAEVKKVVPFRASAIAALRDAYTAGRKPRIIVAQNTNDGACYHNHFQPLCRAFDIPLDGGIDSRHRAIKAVPVDWADGHSDGAEGTTEWLFATQVPWLFERVPA